MAELTGELITADELEAAGADTFELSSILNFKQQAERFRVAFANLLAWEDQVRGTELEDEYDELAGRGFGLRDQIASVMQKLDAALRWLKGLIPGLDGLAAGGLGILPLIPIAAIVAVLAVIGFWLADYAKFAKKFAEQQRIAAQLRAEGVAPVEANRQAAAAVADTTPGALANVFGSGGLFSSPWLIGALLVGGGFYFWSRNRSR